MRRTQLNTKLIHWIQRTPGVVAAIMVALNERMATEAIQSVPCNTDLCDVARALSLSAAVYCL